MQQANDVSFKYATREKNPTNDDNMIYYSETFPYDYTIATDGETVISLPDIPLKAEIVQVSLEIRILASGVPAGSPLAEYSWNPISRVLTLINRFPIISPADGSADVYPTTAGQLLSVLYKIKKTTL